MALHEPAAKLARRAPQHLLSRRQRPAWPPTPASPTHVRSKAAPGAAASSCPASLVG